MVATVTNSELLKHILATREELGAVVTQLTVMAEEVKRHAILGEENRRALRGSNGDQAGLIAKVNAMKDRLDQTETHRNSCGIDTVIKVLNGNDKDPGLIERVRKLEELDASIKKWTWLLSSAVALAVLSMIIDLAPKLIVLLNQ